MNKKKWMLLICAVLVVVIAIPAGWAYYEYVGKYSLLINGDGTINQNAFGVLNSETYRQPQYGYGTTPENPFVIDGLERLNNLIRLNNTGRLLSSKLEDGIYTVSQYYFVLDFTSEELAQVLNLEGRTISSVGNNEYPFIDELSGLLYAYCYAEGSYIYLSGCIEPSVVKVDPNTGVVTIDGVETQITGTAQSGEYIKLPSMYIDYANSDPDKISAGSEVYIPLSDLIPVHNVIANATVSVPDSQVDVGFFNCISRDTVTTAGGNIDVAGYVHDVIFYNITVTCTETLLGTVRQALVSVWDQIFGSHNFEDTYDYIPDTNEYYERHIGLFAGHIDGAASRITVAGNCNIEIDTKGVNYYSGYATVGYVHDTAVIGGVPFSELIGTETGIDIKTGCLFADSIMAIAEGDPNRSAYIHIVDGKIRYELKEIPESGLWGGVSLASNGEDLLFTYGTFNFILSDDNDTVNTIWSGAGPINLLNAEGFVVTESVLYCNDEYRYSSAVQTGGSLVPGAASANETRYQGIRTLVATGSMLDRGKYIIVAKYPYTVGGVTVYGYYALKIVAEVGEGNEIFYSFDNEKCDITEYITDNIGTIYLSALWQTAEDSATPTFRNCRFDTQYLSVDASGGGIAKKLTNDAGEAAEFSYSVANNAFTYTLYETTESGVVSVDYYLNYDPDTGFYFSTEKNTIIEIYRLSNGFTIEPVTSVSDIAANEDYLIAAQTGGSYYLLGEEILETAGSTTVTATGEFSDDYIFAEMPTHWTLEDYQSFRQYIWYARTAGAAGSSAAITLCEKISGTYYLSQAGGTLDLLAQSAEWTYTHGTGNGGYLSINMRYLAHSPQTDETGFYLSEVQYQVYLYRVIANDYEPKYNTYQGARLVTTESSVVQEGDYMIAADTGSGYVGLVMTGAGTLANADLTAYIEETGNMSDLISDTGEYSGYKWRVDTTSAKPTLRNVGFPSYLSRSGNSNVTLSDEEVVWMYDATSGRLYYNVVDENQIATSYYLAWDGNIFVITEGHSTPGYNYNIRLYKITFRYVYSDVIPVESMPYEHSIYGQDRLYFILSAPLHDLENTAAYILGAKGYETGSAVESIDISPTSDFDDGAKTLTTTTDLSYYRWRFDPVTSSGTTIYPAGYQFKNDATGMYLAASTAQQSRTLVVAELSNINGNRTTGGLQNASLPPTGIGLGGGRSYSGQPFYNTEGGVFSGSLFYIMGNHQNYEYFLWKTPIPGVFALSLKTARPDEYTIPYLYSSSGYTINVTVSALSERGDNISAGIHYMITAMVENDNGTTSYYAISKIFDQAGNARLGGVNVTSQADTINTSKIYDDEGNVIEESSTDTLRMVPVESDWLQISSEKGLKFYQSYYSTNALREYLDVSGGLPAISTIPVDSAAQPAEWYYDAISKYFKYYDGDICYYLTYNVPTDSFSLTTDIGEATHFNIYQFKPTYIVTQVTDAGDDKLKTGNFIVAAESSGSYIAIGVTEADVVSKDVTEYIKPELSETEYLEILNFIWKQQYYDFSGATYDPVSSTQYLQLFSLITGGGFTTAYDVGATGGLQTGSDPMVWRIAKNTNGLWSFINNGANGDVAAGSRYIRYNGPQSYLQLSDGILNIGNYLGDYFDGAEFSTQGSLFYLCDTDGNVITSISQVTSGASYILRATFGGESFMIRCTETTVSLVRYDLINTEGCLFTATLGPDGIVLRNGNNYATANADGELVVSSTPAGSWRIGADSTLSYTSVRIPYRYSSNYARLSTDISGYSAKVYRYSYSSPYTTLTPATAPLNTSDDYVIVLHNSTNGTYHAMYSHSNFSFRPYSITVTVIGDNLRISGSLAANYRFRVYQSGELYRFQSRARTRYLGYDGTNLTSTTSSQTYIWSIDSNANIYYIVDSPTYSPGMIQLVGFITPTSGGGTVYAYILSSGAFIPVTGGLLSGGTYAFVVYQGGRYHLVRYDGVSGIELLDLGTQLPASLSDAGVEGSARFKSAAGEDGVYLYNPASELYLNVSNSFATLSAGKTTEWRYSYDTQKLYTVSRVTYAPQFITRTSGTTVSYTTSLLQTWLYEAVPDGSGGYTLSRLESTMQTAGRDVVIVMYTSGGAYYAVARSGNNIVATQINLSGTTVSQNMIWRYDGTYFSYESAGETRYLRMGTSTLTTATDVGYFAARYWTTSFTTANNSDQATYFHIYRVDMSSELDDVTDISTMLTGRAMLTPSISLLESSKYVLVAEVDTDKNGSIDKYFSLGMVNSSISQAIDITYPTKTALATGGNITLFDSCVWEQRGSGFKLIFDNCGFEDTYYLTGSLGNRDSMEPKVIHPETPPEDFSDFIWRTYTFEDGSYLFGYTEDSGSEPQVYYLYFDTVSGVFKLTTSYTKATGSGGVVQLYQLGVETVEQPYFTISIIVTEGDIIVSYPLNLVESRTDLKKYQVIEPVGDEGVRVEGEYLIVAKSGVHFYALTIDDYGGLGYIDVSPYFNGNYNHDDLGNLCLSINQRYIWRQMNEVSDFWISPELSFLNVTTNSYLAGITAAFEYDFENSRLFHTPGGTRRYLNFTAAGGFEFNTDPAGVEVYLYSLGALGIDTGDGGTLNYTYYSIPLSTSLDSSVTFGSFEFIKKKIPELHHYAVGSSGTVEKTVGWKLPSNGEKLAEVNSSVFFAKGYTYNPEAENPLDAFAGEFSECFSSYSVSNGTSGEVYAGNIGYFAPAGMASFVIAEASSTKPVFVNIIVSTEFDSAQLNPDFLRYLALWRVADINIVNGTAKALKPYGDGNGSGITDYAYTFEQKLNTPDFAIPLPNRYASAESGASYARVEGEDHILSAPAYGQDYLIAHTFVITNPGVYYLGSTYGSLAVCYLAIDNMAEGEAAGGVGYASEFSIDFCYGSINLGTTSEFSPDTADNLLGSLCYVGKEGWYHSNIYPIFTGGTAENLTDRLSMKIVRVQNPDNTSSVNVVAFARARVAPGVQYVNDNTIAERAVRKVSFRVFCDGLAAGLYGSEATVYWTASKSETDNTFRIYSTYPIGGVINSYYISADASTPMLSTSGSYYWTCSEEGYLVSPDGKYLTYSLDEFGLSATTTDAVRVYKLEGGELTQVSAISNGGGYLLLVPASDGNYRMLKIAPETE